MDSSLKRMSRLQYAAAGEITQLLAVVDNRCSVSLCAANIKQTINSIMQSMDGSTRYMSLQQGSTSYS